MSCGAGTFSAGGNAPCVSCRTGPLWSSDNVPAACSGKYSSANAATCENCPIGSSTTTSGATVCSLCPRGECLSITLLTVDAGKFASSQGTEGCDVCEPDRV